MKEYKEPIGYKQLKCIIQEFMDGQATYPKWDFLNNVLSCDEILGEYELWFIWGNLRIVPSEDRYASKTAGDFAILQDWNTEKDGTITLIPEIEEKEVGETLPQKLN